VLGFIDLRQGFDGEVPKAPAANDADLAGRAAARAKAAAIPTARRADRARLQA